MVRVPQLRTAFGPEVGVNPSKSILDGNDRLLFVQKNKKQKLRNTKSFFSAQNNPEVA